MIHVTYIEVETEWCAKDLGKIPLLRPPPIVAREPIRFVRILVKLIRTRLLLINFYSGGIVKKS